MAKKNTEILNQIKANASAEYQVRIPDAHGTGANVLGALSDYPTMRNEFINSLTNKVVKTLVFNRNYENKLKRFHKGVLEFGSSIEQIFVRQAEVKNWGEHFTGSDSVEGDLIRKQESTVYVNYVSKNYEYKTKVSISEQQLQTAFNNQQGLSQLVNELVVSATKALEVQEYKDMRDILINYPKALDYKGEALTSKTVNGTVISKDDIPVVSVGSSEPKAILKTLRRLAEDVQFLTNEFNASGVETSCDPSDLVFITNSTTKAEIDVDALASIFNLDKAESKFSTIVIDKLPTGGADSAIAEGKKCLGFLVDRDFIQAWDIVRHSGTFFNPESMITNQFHNRSGLLAQTLFVNAIVITD